jgi:hypothetical protein
VSREAGAGRTVFRPAADMAESSLEHKLLAANTESRFRTWHHRPIFDRQEKEKAWGHELRFHGGLDDRVSGDRDEPSGATLVLSVLAHGSFGEVAGAQMRPGDPDFFRLGLLFSDRRPAADAQGTRISIDAEGKFRISKRIRRSNYGKESALLDMTTCAKQGKLGLAKFIRDE